jgi:hypothetical protein
MLRRLFSFLFALAAFSWLGTGASWAAGKVWAGLYLAENREPAPTAIVAPEPLHHRLHEVFGFKHYELIKGQEIGLHHEWAHWFLPRRDFFLRLEPLHHEEDAPQQIAYEIYKDGFIVAKGTYEPRDGTPLFINGPDFNEGRFIFVLEPRPPKAEDKDDD